MSRFLIVCRALAKALACLVASCPQDRQGETPVGTQATLPLKVSGQI
jgi:hypothetical protein